MAKQPPPLAYEAVPAELQPRVHRLEPNQPTHDEAPKGFEPGLVPTRIPLFNPVAG